MSNTHTITNEAMNRGTIARTIMALAIALVALISGFGRQALAQQLSQRSTLSRLAQSTGNDAASVALKTGRDYLDDQQWLKAQQKFNEYVTSYPSDKNVDQGLYWLAYSQLKLEQYKDCQKTLTRLLARYPNSTWSRDGQTLWVQVPGASPLQSTENDTDDFKVAVLQALFQADVTRGIAAATDFLKQGSTASVRLKGAALRLLAREGGRQVTPIILNVATNEQNIKLRTLAISALASVQDDSVLDPLRDFALNSQENEVVEAALYAIGQHSSPRAITVLGEIAMSNKSTTLRRLAISSIARRSGDPAVDQLLKIYDAEPNIEIRKTIISGFASRRSERAGAKLLEIARGADNIELRKSAINGIARRGGDQAVDILLNLYDTEKNEELKDQIINALGYGPLAIGSRGLEYPNDQRVTRKLIEIARNPQAPLERRKRAIGWLSRSKDPEVLKFLEDLLK